LEVVSLKHPVDSALEQLDAGEREAISLASELQAVLLLMDERDGVTIARHRGLKVVGTLATLDLAAAHGLIDLQTMFERLRTTTFRSPARLMVSMLKQDAERRTQETSGRPTVNGLCSTGPARTGAGGRTKYNLGKWDDKK
jgi:predicted nucleic acid-binding protein